MTAPKPRRVNDNRAPRCEHGFYRRLCVVSACPHWDQRSSHRGAELSLQDDEPDDWSERNEPDDWSESEAEGIDHE